MLTPLPPVTIIIPTFNEQSFIERCVMSILSGSYPKADLEILIIDGGSTDKTLEIINSLSERHSSVKVLLNPKKIVPSAVNIGIACASHDYIVWLGAHATYDSNYIRFSIETLLDEKCASVGGVITPVGQSKTGKAIAAATSSKFGVGNAKYRYATEKQAVDTVFGGCWKKEDILRIGGVNESWVKNQDYELNCRLRELVGKIILDPRVKCNYFCRESIHGLAKQYFNYGFWRFRTFAKHPKSLTIRQVAPLVLLMGFIASALIAFIDPMLGLLLPSIYISANLLTSLFLSFKHGQLGYILLLPSIFVTLHLCWAVGFAKGLTKSSVAQLN